MRERMLKESVAKKEEEYTKRKQTQLANYKKLQEESTQYKEKKAEPDNKFFQVIHYFTID